MKVLWFLIRFAVFAPLCLVVWWNVMPYYGWLIGNIAAQAMGLFGEPVSTVRIDVGGILNTETRLTLQTGDHTKSDMIGAVVTNMAPFAALVLATAGLGIKRRLQVMAAGAAILMASHIVYLVWAIAVLPSVDDADKLPTIVGQVFVTMPFLLWIVLAYWKSLLELMTPPTQTPQS